MLTLREMKKRFWWFYDKARIGEGGCWFWTGNRYNTRQDYGRADVCGRAVQAHRLSYELATGPIPRGLLIRHTCDRQCCVNPAHLLPGTVKENSQDAVERGRTNKVHGEHHPCAKLTDEQVTRIRASSGPYRATAAAFGISPTLVGLIRRRKVWKHLR